MNVSTKQEEKLSVSSDWSIVCQLAIGWLEKPHPFNVSSLEQLNGDEMNVHIYEI